MRLLENKLPPLLVCAVFGLLMWLIAESTARIELSRAVQIVATTVVTLIAAFFAIAGVVSFRRARTTVDPRKPDTASSLVTSGIYRITRNPMYVGFAILLLAWAINLASAWSLFGVAGFVYFIDRLQVAPEERALTVLFGAEFNEYKAKVRRWL